MGYWLWCNRGNTSVSRYSDWFAYGLPKSRIDPEGRRDISLLQSVLTTSPPHPTSCLMGNGDSVLLGKGARSWWSWPLPSSGDVKYTWNHVSIAPSVFMAWCLIKQKGNFLFYFTVLPCCASVGIAVLISIKKKVKFAYFGKIVT
jgi:hypothetical protein